MFQLNFRLFITLIFASSLYANSIDLNEFDLPNETKNEIFERVDGYTNKELLERKSFLLASLDAGDISPDDNVTGKAGDKTDNTDVIRFEITLIDIALALGAGFLVSEIIGISIYSLKDFIFCFIWKIKFIKIN